MLRSLDGLFRWSVLGCALALATACADGAPLVDTDASPGSAIPPPPLPDKPGSPPPGAPAPDTPQPEPEAPQPGPEAEPPPEGGPDDECMGVDFLGVCHGTLAVWCEEGQLFAFECADEGLDCDFIDEDIGYYCVPDRGPPPPEDQPQPPREPDPEPEPEPGQPPPDLPPAEDPPAEPADPCPGVDWFGRCEGNTAVWCDDEEEILQFDCGWIGMVCQDLGIFGHRCVSPDQGQNPPQNPGSPGG